MNILAMSKLDHINSLIADRLIRTLYLATSFEIPNDVLKGKIRLSSSLFKGR